MSSIAANARTGMSGLVSDLDTIVAVATPRGRGGVGIVRVSGAIVTDLATAVLGALPEPRRARYTRFLASDGETLDQGLALYFPAPGSYTGEDVLELQGHGGPVVMDLLVERLLGLGARAARPGEFTQRAYLNGRMDLAQAEAVADLIDSATEQAARAAVHSLQGEFSARIDALVEGLIGLRTHVEAAIDFPEEEIDFLEDGGIVAELANLRGVLDEVMAGARQGQLLRDGAVIVIAGRPNVGKSSLMNALSGCDSAIVTDIPGTTRDLVRAQIDIDGMPVNMIDTAGLRDSTDPVEMEGIRRARKAIDNADLVLMVVDDRDGPDSRERALLDDPIAGTRSLLVRNKTDLTVAAGDAPAAYGGLRISALTGEGIGELRERLKAAMGFEATAEGAFMARRRHLEALAVAAESLRRGDRQLRVARAGELLAEELRAAQQALAGITGEFSNEDLLGRIFSSFCIGK